MSILITSKQIQAMTPRVRARIDRLMDPKSHRKFTITTAGHIVFSDKEDVSVVESCVRSTPDEVIEKAFWDSVKRAPK